MRLKMVPAKAIWGIVQMAKEFMCTILEISCAIQNIYVTL